ncbi:Fe2+-enterobactin ABC transporter substrate-binding protein [Kocuria sp.]|uniref:Fe2+-enterobactin ABC transporter substrate-binding protein n=1 Tax=Kocuria sp. TaxID=1871328 RepID=UPI0026DEFC5C|nr:ABC transporter substrate-binding protein [Kocuria sp.]MDO5618425.1 ABC transporter substrate-binding protein [Kocuria sp.]
MNTNTLHKWGPLGFLKMIAVAMIAVFALAACGNGGFGDDSATDAAGDSTRTIETDQGNIEVPADAERIVVLSGSLAGYVFALDAPVVATDTRVIGVTDLSSDFPEAWADEAEEQGTEALPGGEQLSVEAVAAAEPDLIIGGGQGITAVQAEEAYDDLKEIAPTVLVPSSVTDWQGELNMIAETLGKEDQANEMISAYDERVEEVKEAITVPEGEFEVLLSLSTDEPSLIPADAALPKQLESLGFTASDVYTKAGEPELYGSGDSFNVSTEVLPTVADAQTAFVINLGGKTADELKEDSVYSQLPAFEDDQVYELPAASYRPDYDGAMGTLDQIEEMFS